jgi:hypothetical protein
VSVLSHVAPGGNGDGDDGARAQRFVVCHNPEQAERDAVGRSNLIAHLQHLIDGSDAWTARKRDELVESLKTKPGLRHLRRTKAGLLRIDHGAAKREAHLDGKWLLRTSDVTLTPQDLAAAKTDMMSRELSRCRWAMCSISGRVTSLNEESSTVKGTGISRSTHSHMS